MPGLCAAGNTPDVVLGRSGISTGSVTGLTVDSSTYVAVDLSWTASEGNYVAVNTAANQNNLALANAFIALVSAAKVA